MRYVASTWDEWGQPSPLPPIEGDDWTCSSDATEHDPAHTSRTECLAELERERDERSDRVAELEEELDEEKRAVWDVGDIMERIREAMHPRRPADGQMGFWIDVPRSGDLTGGTPIAHLALNP